MGSQSKIGRSTKREYKKLLMEAARRVSEKAKKNKGSHIEKVSSLIAYCDASAKGSSYGVGVCILDLENKEVCRHSKKLEEAKLCNTTIEGLAILEAIDLALSLNTEEVTIYSDCASLVDVYQSGVSKRPGIGRAFLKAVSPLRDNLSIKLEWVKSHQKTERWNELADKLAKQGGRS